MTDELRAKFEAWLRVNVSDWHHLPADVKRFAEHVFAGAHASRDAEVEAMERDAEIGFLEHWLREASEPVGQECCGRGRGECCGSPDPVYLTPEQVFRAMSDRHAELVDAMVKESGK